MKELNKNTVGKPELPVKIVQFGTGNFLRAFFDWMIDRSNHAGITNHGIAMVQSTDRNDTLGDRMREQDYMFHVCLEGIKDKKPVRETTLVQSVVTMVNAAREYGRYMDICLGDELEIVVSNTTEAGIRYVEEDIFAEPPASFPAKMAALLYGRYKKFGGAADKGLMVLCTELIESNGSTLKKYVLQHASRMGLEQDFANWVDSACSFYDTLVDRIVPGSPKDLLPQVKAELGYDDDLVVMGEYFHVWAIGGDDKIRQRLPLDKAGLNVIFMNDITDFRAKKVRVLNGAHTAMVPVALQLGCETVLDAFGNPDVERYINRMVGEEVLPVIDSDPDELQQFAASILERFYNPYLKHRLRDISLNSLSKWETRDFPTVADNAKSGRTARLTIFSLAALLVLYSGAPQGVEFTPTDTPEFVDFIRSTFDRDNIPAWVSGIVNHPTMWSADLGSVPSLAAEVAQGVTNILDKGMASALKELI